MSDATIGKTIAQRLGPVQAGLRTDLEVTRHVFRGQPQYVVRDPLTFQTHQFSQYDYQILIAIRDSVPLEEIFHSLVDDGSLTADQEAEFYQFILTPHRLNYLILPIADGKVLYERFASRQRQARWRQISGFLFLRVPLVNPDAFLDRTVNWVRPLFTRIALCLWMIMMLTGVGLLARRWDAFKDPMHSILASETLLFIWFALIALKVVHEFGHAYACKVFGGRVPEMGAFFIAFTPCAYMDASAAWGFSKMRHRVMVSLAGMYFESFVAFLAVIVWCWTDDPLISSCAHHIVVLSSAVTIGFNVNPLMRHDGYYVLSDLTGIPNLRQRSIEQVQSVLKRWVLGIPVPAAATTLRERAFLLSYGLSSSVYKVVLVLAICTMIALKFYLVGVALAAFFLLGVLATALRRLLNYLWRSQETRPVRARAIALSMVLLVLVPAAVAKVPLPGRVAVPGIVQTLDVRNVPAQVSGTLLGAEVSVGSCVQEGEAICQLRNAVLDTAAEESRAVACVARLQFERGVAVNPVSATAARLRLDHAQEMLAQSVRECGRLCVVAPVSGVVTKIVDQRDTGRFVSKGESLATIAAGPWIVRCLATAEQIASIRPSEGREVRVRLQLDGVRETSGTIERVGVKGSRHVFSAALTQLGGGQIAVDPEFMVTATPLFEIAVRPHDAHRLPLRHEGRATVLFNSEPRTCGSLIYRRFHQFLNRLRVR